MRGSFAAALLFCLAACGAHPIATDQAAPASANAVANPARAPQPIAARPGPPLLARCWMGTCVWFRIVSRQSVRETGGERLLRVAVIFGEPRHQDDNLPDPPRDDSFLWGESPDEIWFLCSPSRPTVILERDAGGWEATQLDFVRGPSGYTEAVAAQYVAACHPGDDRNRPGVAERHNYRYDPEYNGSYVLPSPEAVFGHRR